MSKLISVVTGVAGQDGSYLTEYLLSRGYYVIGITKKHNSHNKYENLKFVINNKDFKLIEGDVTDPTLISRVLSDYRPHEWYNLAAASHVGQSFCEPSATFDIDAKAVITQLELIRQFSPYTRFYQASTSELFGGLKCPQEGYDESTPFHPRSPYGVAKLAAYWATKNYREAYGIYAVNGILHNHSSPRRGMDFATRKISHGVASIKLGLTSKVKMGDLSAFRDEGHSKDYCIAMNKMLKQDDPEDLLIATGSGATIDEMLRYTCQLADLTFDEIYEKDARFLRPSEVPFLKGNPKKAFEKLGWRPTYSWKELLEEMYYYDLQLLKREK
jgi:GDPmannose 4,6-dehydratase